MTASLYQFAGNKEAEPDHSPENFTAAQDLPELSLAMIEQLFDRLSTEDKVQTLRHKIVPVASLPHITLYGAAGTQATQRAREKGKRVIARINPQDLRLITRRRLGTELLRKATHHLCLRRPEYSALTRITGLQSFWIGMILVWAAAAWVLLDPFYFFAGLSFFCGVFFLAVIALRLLCLLQEKEKPASPPPHPNDEDLPDYTVLVPVFRETQMLPQLIHSLACLNYPTLCIKRTKTE